MSALPTFDDARRDPWFWHCVNEAMETPGFVENWNRLHGFPVARSPIELMVDTATGAMKDRAQQFIRDVYETVYTRIPRPA